MPPRAGTSGACAAMNRPLEGERGTWVVSKRSAAAIDDRDRRKPHAVLNSRTSSDPRRASLERLGHAGSDDPGVERHPPRSDALHTSKLRRPANGCLYSFQLRLSRMPPVERPGWSPAGLWWRLWVRWRLRLWPRIWL